MALRDEQAYRCVVSHLDHPMFIVTVASDRQRAGCLVGFATQCRSSIRCAGSSASSKLNHTFAIAATASVAVVHALGADHVALARLVGERTGDNILDKFAHCQWRPGPDGRTPVLDECQRWFAGEVVGRVDPGDHLGLVLAPFAAQCRDHGPQLGIQALPHVDPGHPS